jgi:cytochrome c553
MKAARLCLLVVGILIAADGSAAPAPIPPIDPKTPGAIVSEQVCATCHGANGMSTLANVPNLAGQQKDYLVKQLREFRKHTRSDPQARENMWSIAHKLSERQVDELAGRYAGLKPQAQPNEGTPEQIAAGKGIFNGDALAKGIPPCSGCHGADGAGKPMFPRLAGQHMDYLVSQIMVFQRSEDRPGASIMKSVSHDLAPADVLNVAAYLQALPHEAAR